MDNLGQSPRLDASIIERLSAIQTTQRGQNKLIVDLHRAVFTGNGQPPILSTLAKHETRLKALEWQRHPVVLKVTLGAGAVSTLAWVVKAILALGAYLK